MENQRIKKITLIYLSISIVVVLVFIIIKSIHISPFGPGVTINNFKEYFPKASQVNEDGVSNLVYQILLNTIDDPTSIRDIVIRKDSVRTETDANDLNHSSLIIDIPSIQQSYIISFTWGNESTDNDLEQYDIKCPSKNEKIYNTDCYLSAEDDPNLSITHSYLLRNILSEPLNTRLYETVFSYIDSEEEYSTGNKENERVELVISEDSFEEYYDTDSDDYIYSITASTDDGRDYKIYTRSQQSLKKPGIAILINRLDIKNHQYAVIISVDDNKLIKRLESWLYEEAVNNELSINKELIDSDNEPAIIDY